MSVLSLPWSTHRGNLRSAGISRFIARPLRLSGSHHLRRGHPTTSFYIGRGTRVLPLRLIPQELLDRRSPGYLPVVMHLDAVLDPGVSASHSSLTRSPHGLRPYGEDRHNPKLVGSRGYVSDSGLHPSPRRTRASPSKAFTFGRRSTERLTRPYSGGLLPPRGIPSQRATIARLPHNTSIPILRGVSYSWRQITILHQSISDLRTAPFIMLITNEFDFVQHRIVFYIIFENKTLSPSII